MNAEPVGSPGMEEMRERIREAMREHELNMSEITQMSDVSFLHWVESVGRRIAAALGIPLAKLHALFDDMRSIGGNMKDSFRASYRDAYNRSRKIKRTG
ncbi:hypothetical protein [Streptomyces paludis]|nr:hypothetical protein [Streptomyces paludis]